jgi:hypothetical protein
VDIGSPKKLQQAGIMGLSMVRLDHFLRTVQTGTVILKGHKTCWFKNSTDSDDFESIDFMIKVLTTGFFSHTAVIVRNPPQHILDLYSCPTCAIGVYVFQSSGCYKGVALHPFKTASRNWLRGYNIRTKAEAGELSICFRELHSTKDLDVGALWLFMEQVHGVRFPLPGEGGTLQTFCFAFGPFLF